MTDDLTSATDGTAAFAEAGWSTRVVRWSPRLREHPDADVLSIDVASRRLPAQEAVERVQNAILVVAKAPILVKQFDSTLRGNVAAEALAMLRATNRRQLLVAAAFPSAGRVTIAGVQYVDGVRVDQSSYARDLLNPVPSSDLSALFAAEGVAVSSDCESGDTVVVLDAQTEDHLDRLVARHIEDPSVIFAGSPGVVRALARESKVRFKPLPRSWPRCHRALVAVGSTNPRSRQQLAVLARQGIPVVEVGRQSSKTAIEFVTATAQAGTRALALASSQAPGHPDRMARQIGHVVGQLIRAGTIDGLIVTGGETLASILDHLNVQELTVCAELEPGVPVCCFDAGGNVLLISKAGGFGTREIFAKALAVLLR